MPSKHNMPLSNALSSRRACVIGEADPFLARLLRRFAEKCGFRALHAQVGEALLALVAQEQPALVVLDPQLPGKLRGWEACQQIWREDASCAAPVILCTWLKPDEAQALVGRPAAHLQKPDLHYEDFAGLLAAAGIRVEPEDGSGNT